MIGQAKEKYPDLRFQVMDAREIIFPEPFDAVFSNATHHWIRNSAHEIEPSLKLLASA